MNSFSTLNSVLAPVLITASFGYGWARLGVPFDMKFAVRLVTYVGPPCLVFSALTRAQVSPESLATTAGAVCICMAIFALIGSMALKFAKLPLAVYLPPLMNPNVGNMGLPICFFAFGEEGLAFVIAVYATLTVVSLTSNIWIASGTASPVEALRQPAIPAALVGFGVLLFDFNVPSWLDNTTWLIGGVTIPVMLMALGANLAQIQLTEVGRSFVIGASRLAMGLVVGVAIVSLLQIEGVARKVIVLDMAMPPAVFSFLFAQLYDRRPEEVASIIAASTLMACVTIPVILSFLL